MSDARRRQAKAARRKKRVAVRPNPQPTERALGDVMVEMPPLVGTIVEATAGVARADEALPTLRKLDEILTARGWVVSDMNALGAPSWDYPPSSPDGWGPPSIGWETREGAGIWRDNEPVFDVDLAEHGGRTSHTLNLTLAELLSHLDEIEASRLIDA